MDSTIQYKIMNRTNILNYLIKQYNFSSYLEIGVENENTNFNKINCQFRIGVDPNVPTCFTGTSDDFFQINLNKFDLIFIDGDHKEEQVTKDINNAVDALTPNGIIVLHDCLPEAEWQQTEEYNNSIWTGTVWRSLAKIRMNNPNLHLDIVNTDWGCGILKVGPSQLYTSNDPLDYNFYINHKTKIFNIISTDEFIKKYRNDQ